MKLRLIQMSLVVQILQAIATQAKEAGLKESEVQMTAKQTNAVIKAATDITRAFDKEPVYATPDMGLKAWVESDDTGLSSMAMAYHLAGVYCEDPTAHPHDPSDFGRCYRFLEAVRPSAQSNVGRKPLSFMTPVSPVWARLVEHWLELSDLYLREGGRGAGGGRAELGEQELPTGLCPKLAARMQELGC